MDTSAPPTIAQQELTGLDHVVAELGRIDALIEHAVQRWQAAGQHLEDGLRGLCISDEEASWMAQRPFGSNWGDLADLSPDQEQAIGRAYAAASSHAEDVLDRLLREGRSSPLVWLVQLYDLDAFDLDALLICLAPALDLRYGRLYGYLQDDVTQKRPTVNLILDLLCPSGVERLNMVHHFVGDAPLIRNNLVSRSDERGRVETTGLATVLTVAPTVVAWLLGRYEPAPELTNHVELTWPKDAETYALIAGQETSQRLYGWLDEMTTDMPPLLAFRGCDGVAQEAAAQGCAQHLGRPLLMVDMAAALADDTATPLRLLELALRDALLLAAVPCLTGWQACLDDDHRLPVPLLEALCAHPDLVMLAGKDAWLPGGMARGRPILAVALAMPDHAQRRALWKHFLADRPGADDLADGATLGFIADQFALTTGQIRDAVASACDRAAGAGRPLEAQDVLAAAQAHSNPHLAALARQITPRYTWEDIVLPADQLELLHEIVNTVRERPLVLEAWGLGQKLSSSAGVTVLFSGDPGTGKTMAAEVIAHALGLDLFKIDLSTLVSKYIGETEKNLERIFSEAQSSNAILFFDEADAIFGKRSEVKDAHDRYANIEVSYLLQRMERYDGVTILATNLRANLDEAFSRRLQFAVDFPFPEAADRERIWRTLLPPDLPCDTELDFGELAQRYRLAGGNIRNILMSAAYLAAADGKVVTREHLLHGTRREMRKMGRLMSEGGR